MTPPEVSRSITPVRAAARGYANGLSKLGDGLAGLLSFRSAMVAQRWKPERIRAAQLQSLRWQIEHACRTVPYYRELLSSAGVRHDDIRSVADLQHLPITTKQDLRDAGYDACISSAFRDQELHLQSTSGSSGQPFKVYRERSAERRRSGFLLRALAAAGYRLGDRLLLVVEPPEGQPPTWTRWRKIGFEQSAEHLLREVNNHRPKIVFGYVSPLRQLAKLVSEGAPLRHRPESVVTVSESLDPATRHLIADAMKTDVFEIYGNVECGTIAWECSTHHGLHVAEDSVVLELLPTGESGSSRIVVTNLHGLAMPFIRFDTGDLAAVSPHEENCACGCALSRMGRVSGREMDGVTRPDGTFVAPFSLTNVVGAIPGIKRYQLVQFGVGQIRVRLEQAAMPSSDVAGRIESGIRGVVGPDTQVVLEIAPSLEPPPGRKFRLVENRIPRA
jgi:phenylacetate-CoA ligase